MSTILLHHGGKTTTPFADAPDMWPLNSPDLNPVDFAVWGALQQMVYHLQRFDSVDELKRAIVKAWDKLSQAFLNMSWTITDRYLKQYDSYSPRGATVAHN